MIKNFRPCDHNSRDPQFTKSSIFGTFDQKSDQRTLNLANKRFSRRQSDNQIKFFIQSEAANYSLLSFSNSWTEEFLKVNLMRIIYPISILGISAVVVHLACSYRVCIDLLPDYPQPSVTDRVTTSKWQPQEGNGVWLTEFPYSKVFSTSMTHNHDQKSNSNNTCESW